MATLIKSDGTLSVVHPKAGIGKAFTLEELQEFVGGYIELLHPQSGHVAIVNEEGRWLGLAPNQRASLATGYDLVGDVLICENSEIK